LERASDSQNRTDLPQIRIGRALSQPSRGEDGFMVMSQSKGAEWLGLEDRGVIVTGAGGGIGRSVARAFADAGSHVLAIDINAEAVESLVTELPGGTKRHHALAGDLTDLTWHDTLLRAGMERFGRLDVLAHLAAVLRRRADIDEITEDDWDAQINTNLKATFFLNRAAAHLFREQGRGGVIVNCVSQAFWSGGLDGAVVYAASKGGVVSMSRGLARTLARDGIRVNTVAPGIVDTPLLRSGLDDEGVSAQIDTVPLGRLAEPDEIASAVVFLSSDKASYVTGATLNVSGGQLMY
jgi:NAD(P)-dependent dehydrogenase (short-subunit alcohol dehydrogenase family)